MHIFTTEHVPNKFIPLGLSTAMKWPVLRGLVTFLLDKINPFSNRDLFHRYSNFIRISYQKTQQQVFEKVRSYYPLDSKFVVLPMDMAFMDAGKIPIDIYRQHKELKELRDKYPDQVIPFIAADPRRNDVLSMVKELVEKYDFRGIKIYPPLGYLPDHPKLYQVYEYAQLKNIPIMTHCSRGGVKNKKLPKHLTTSYADPDNYQTIMKDFPDLRICMGHFGGEQDWDKYLNDPWDNDLPPESKSWVSKILDMMRSEEFPNLYADISYTIFSFQERVPALKVFLENPRIADKVLLGSDFYMVEAERFRERRLSLNLRAIIGKSLFEKIATENAQKYLGDDKN